MKITTLEKIHDLKNLPQIPIEDISELSIDTYQNGQIDGTCTNRFTSYHYFYSYDDVDKDNKKFFIIDLTPEQWVHYRKKPVSMNIEQKQVIGWFETEKKYDLKKWLLNRESWVKAGSVESDETHICEFRDFLKKLVGYASGANNNVHFSMFAYNIEDSALLPLQAVWQGYGLKIPEKIDIDTTKYKGTSIEDMVSRIHKSITYIDNPFAGWKPTIDNKKSHDSEMVEPTFDYEKTVKEYWEKVGTCIDYKNAHVWEVCLPASLGDVFWNFDYVIYNSKQHRCIYLHGGASD
jgi:hypothetical protein